MPAFKPAYLIHGDDHGRIAERRTRLRAIAEAASGAQGLELFEGETSSPETVAAALAAMTFAFGRRFIVVDGTERWKDKEMDELEAGDANSAVRLYVALRAQGERVPGLIYWISTRVRSALAVAQALDAGEAPAQIKRGLRMPSRAADRLIADARRSGADKLRR